MTRRPRGVVVGFVTFVALALPGAPAAFAAGGGPSHAVIVEGASVAAATHAVERSRRHGRHAVAARRTASPRTSTPTGWPHSVRTTRVVVVPDLVLHPKSKSFDAGAVDTQIAALDPGASFSPDAGHGVAVALVDTGVANTPDLRGSRFVRGPDLSGEGDGTRPLRPRHVHGRSHRGRRLGRRNGSTPPHRDRAGRHDRLGQGRRRRRVELGLARHRRHRVGRHPPRRVRHRRLESLVRCRRADAVLPQPARRGRRGGVGVGHHGGRGRRQRRHRRRDVARRRSVRDHRRRDRHRPEPRRRQTTPSRVGRAPQEFGRYSKPEVVAPRSVGCVAAGAGFDDRHANIPKAASATTTSAAPARR